MFNRKQDNPVLVDDIEDMNYCWKYGTTHSNNRYGICQHTVNNTDLAMHECSDEEHNNKWDKVPHSQFHSESSLP